MKATEQYFPVVLFIMLYNVVLTFKSVDEILSVMALGFFNLGLGTHMSDQIGVPSIFLFFFFWGGGGGRGSQTLGDPFLGKIDFWVMRKRDLLANYILK